MKKLTEKVHHEESMQEVVWVRQNEQQQQENAETAASQIESSTDTKLLTDQLPIVYAKQYGVRFAGLEKLHPFDAAKGRHIHKLLCERLVLDTAQFHAPLAEISKEELLRVHTSSYLRSLKWSFNAARIAEIPPLVFVPNRCVQRGYLRPMRFQTAGSIMAGKLALTHGWAINLGGGFHHCCSYQGGGFCPYADITLLIVRLFEQDGDLVRKAMIVDLDAHQGNGHERDFKDNANVYILDMYNSHIYPRDQPAKLSIRKAVELQPGTTDDMYLRKLKRGLTQALTEFVPDIVVYNAGTDVLKGDPLGLLSVTPEGVIARDQLVFTTFRTRRIPVVMLLSGGYLKSSAKTNSGVILELSYCLCFTSYWHRVCHAVSNGRAVSFKAN